MMMARWLVEKDGIFIGSSSAVNCVAAAVLARQMGPGKRIATILCDSGTRHLSKFWAEVGKRENALNSLDDVLYPKPAAAGVTDGVDQPPPANPTEVSGI
jgi:cysteine synthase A